MTDITEQKLAEQRLADKEAQLHVALDNLPGALAYTDENLNIVVCNARFREMYIVPEAMLQPGRPYPAFLRYLAENGYYGEGDVDTLVTFAWGRRERRERLLISDRRGHCIIHHLSPPRSGRIHLWPGRREW